LSVYGPVIDEKMPDTEEPEVLSTRNLMLGDLERITHQTIHSRVQPYPCYKYWFVTKHWVVSEFSWV